MRRRYGGVTATCGVGGDEGPVLGGEAFFLGVVLDVLDGAGDVGGGVEVDVPAVFGPGGVAFAAGEEGVLEGVELGVVQGFGGFAFELVHHLLDIEGVGFDDGVDVEGEDAAGVEGEAAAGDGVLEAGGDGFALVFGEGDGWVAEGALGGVEGFGGEGAAGAGLGGFAGGAVEVEGADEGGEGAAGVVGEPLGVGAEDEVVGEGHGWGGVYRAGGRARRVEGCAGGPVVGDGRGSGGAEGESL